ncbi:MAG TPA: sulfatase-like hydrolase/transferase [Bacteroidales bacterium]|nr:sulfatase-like hydrolase/transferase [Bacteroidales bacterium]
MQKRLKALSYFTIFWLVFFFIARLCFILAQFHQSFQNSFADLSATFWNGAKLDISTTGYYLLLPVLLAIPGMWFNGNWYKVSIRWYSYLLIVFSSIIVVSDANLYSYWGFRMDFTPMLYLKTPGEAMASVSTFKIIMFFITIGLLSSFFIFFYNKLIDRMFTGFERIRYWLPGILFFMILWGALIIPIRGGFGVAPINAGSVYFSKKMFLNHTAVNAIWNVGTTAFTQKPVKNPYEFGDIIAATALVDSLTTKTGISEKVLNTTQPNIIILVLESFSGYLIGPLGGDSLVTPNFNRYVKEGILFSEFYASGTRTDKAMPAILNGYPAQPAQSIIKEPKKSQTLSSIVKILIENGYNSSFWYGGEINFANFNSFVIGSGFNEIITKDNFDHENYNSKWGVHDHVFFEALKDSLEKIKQPFLNVSLTLSSHEPFDVPMETVFAGDDNMTKYKNSVYYTDKSLGSFLDWAKEKEWWKNTLVIMVADHCGRVSADMAIYSQNMFKIPMLWVGGALSKHGIRIDKLGSQVDIPVTLLNQLGLAGSFPFAKDLLSDKSKSFAFYTYNEGFGFITDSSAYIYDHKLGESVAIEGKGVESSEIKGKAYLQVLFNDYLKR